MYKAEAVKFYGSNKALAKAAGRSDAAISRWGEVIPKLAAMELDRKTKGKLKFRARLYNKKKTV